MYFENYVFVGPSLFNAILTDLLYIFAHNHLCTLKREMYVYNPCYEDMNYTTKHIVNQNIILYYLKFQCLQCHLCCTGR